MIPHRQEYPLRKRICPLLADRRQAERARLPSRSSKPCTVGIYRGLISATMFRGPAGQVAASCSLHRLQQAARTWHREMADHARPRSPCSAGAGEEVSAFCTSLLWPCHFSLSAQVRCCCRREWQSYFLFPGSHRPVCSSFWSLFLLVLGLKKKAPKRMVLKIDRRRVVLVSFFSPGTACNSSWRHSPSHAKPCWLVAAIHPESTTNWPETKAIEHAPPFTGHDQGGRDFDFGNLSSPGPLIWLLSCFAKQQSGHSSVIVWFCFSRKSPQKMKKITSLSKQETENKKINEHSWSPFDCVTSRVTQQHSRRYFQLDLTMLCRESMLQLPATRGTRTAVPAICNHWTWRQNKSAKFKSFLPCPLPDFGAFSMTNNSVILWHFLSFFHSMLSFHYLTSMHGKNLKVLCFKTAIWRTLSFAFHSSLKRLKEITYWRHEHTHKPSKIEERWKE